MSGLGPGVDQARDPFHRMEAAQEEGNLLAWCNAEAASKVLRRTRFARFSWNRRRHQCDRASEAKVTDLLHLDFGLRLQTGSLS